MKERLTHYLGLARLLALGLSGSHLGFLALQLRRLLRQDALCLSTRLLCFGSPLLLAACMLGHSALMISRSKL